MRKLLQLFISITLCVISAYSQTQMVVKSAQANVRESPSGTAKIVGKVRKNQKVESSAIQGEWHYIVSGKVRGWIHSSTVGEVEKFKIGPAEIFVLNQGSTSFAGKYKDDWFIFGTTTTSEFYFNPGKAARRGDVVSSWVEERDKDDLDILIAKVLIEVNCKLNKTRSVLGVQYYDFVLTGNEKFQRKIKAEPKSWETPNSDFFSIIPGTIADGLAVKVCAL